MLCVKLKLVLQFLWWKFTTKIVPVFKNAIYLDSMLSGHCVLLLYVIMSTGKPDIKTYPWFSLKPIL